MEDTAVLRNVIHWFCPRGRLTLQISLLWLLVVALFAGCGFIDSRHQTPRTPFSVRRAAEAATLLGGLGIGIATCITGGIMILANVQANRFRKGTAILHLFTSSLVSTICTPVTILLVRPFLPQSWDILGGESVMGLLVVSWWMALASIALFILLTVSVLFSRQQSIGAHTGPGDPNSQRQS
jgi:hypothetical protein